MLLMFLSLICITFFLNAVSVKAATYSWNVNTGDDENGIQYIYEIVTWNSKAADDIFDTKSAEDIFIFILRFQLINPIIIDFLYILL